jgi:hypothetical protein
MANRASALVLMLAITAALAGSTGAQTAPDPRGTQRQVLDKAAAEADRLIAETPLETMALSFRLQLMLPLGLSDPERLRQSVAGLPDDARRQAEAFALAGELARHPESSPSRLEGQRADTLMQALGVAARFLARESPQQAQALAESQTSSGAEGLVRSLAALGLAQQDPDRALRVASEIQEQGQREAVFVRLAEQAGATDAARWDSILARCYGRASRSGLWARRALRLEPTDAEGARKAAGEALREWSRVRLEDPVTPGTARDLVLATGHLAPEQAGALAPGLAERARTQWGATAEALGVLGHYAPDAVRKEVARLLAPPPPGQPETAPWIRAMFIGIGVGVGDPAAWEEAKGAKGDTLPQIVTGAALASPEAALRFVAEGGQTPSPWTVAAAAYQLARVSPEGALALASGIPGANGEGRYVTCEVLRRIAARRPDLALDELARLSQPPGSLDGLPVGPIFRAVAEAKLAAGGTLVPGTGLDLAVDLSRVPMSDATRAQALAGIAVAMAPRYPEQAKAAMLEALRLAGSPGEGSWALPGVIALLGVVDPEVALSTALEVPASHAQPGIPPPRLQVVLALARALAEELGWSEEPAEL